MNDQLQAKLVEILTAIQGAAKATGDFAMSQLPDIAQQYVVYGRATSAIAIAICAAFTGMAVFLVVKSLRFFREGDGDTGCALLMPGTLVGVAGLPTFCLKFSDWLLPWFAPKVWLIQQIAAMLPHTG